MNVWFHYTCPWNFSNATNTIFCLVFSDLSMFHGLTDMYTAVWMASGNLLVQIDAIIVKCFSRICPTASFFSVYYVYCKKNSCERNSLNISNSGRVNNNAWYNYEYIACYKHTCLFQEMCKQICFCTGDIFVISQAHPYWSYVHVTTCVHASWDGLFE